MADFVEAVFEAMESSHSPNRVKIWDGMCNACGASGAIVAYARAALRPSSASGRIIDAVNDVVRHARMVRMACQHLVENLAALLLPRIRLVGRVEVSDRHQLQSVENRGLVVAGVAIADRGQSPFVILRPGRVIDRLPVLVEHREGLDVVALAVRLRVNGARSRAAAPCFSSSGDGGAHIG